MRIGIVGCGANSAYHIRFGRSYKGAEIIGLVDSDQQRAALCAEKFSIGGVFSTVSELVKDGKPDIVHIVTPPRTHFQLAKEVIESKCHVLVEKPLALNLVEGQALFELAERHGVRLCTMHNHYFDPCLSKAYELVRKGSIGRIISIESHYGLNPDIPLLREYPAPNVVPWIYELPYGLYQDFLAHPLYVLLDLIGKPREVHVVQQAHGALPRAMPDEVRILLEGEKAVGTVTLSFVAKPHLHFLRIYGSQMMVEVDFNTMTTVTHPVSSLPKAMARATYNLSTSTQLFTNTVVNAFRFLTGSLKPYQGMKLLIHRFYESIQNGREIPITKDQALLVLGTMDGIGRELNSGPLISSPIRPPLVCAPKHRDKILITGGTGFLGKRLVEQLIREGYSVRVLARKLSNIEPLTRLGAEILFGDLTLKASLDEAFNGISVVVHAAAGTTGSASGCEAVTVEGTRNILQLCEKNSIGKLIYISSCSVYGVTDYKQGEVITEEGILECFPTRRGAYSAAKLRAENLAIEAMKMGKFPVVILRPGTIYGPGGNVFTPMIGLSVKKKAFLVLGNGRMELPLVYIDHVVDAIVKSIQRDEANNEIFNVVDSEAIAKQTYVEKLIKRVYPQARIVYIPYSLVYALVLIQEVAFRLLRKEAFLTTYRLGSSQKTIRYDNTKIVKRLNWMPSSFFDKAIERILNYESNMYQ